MTAGVAAPACVPLPAVGRSRRVLAALRAIARRGLRVRLRCLLLGHEDSFGREPRRLRLRCTTCGRETAGWAIGPGAPAAEPASRVAPGRTAGLDTAFRVGPWTLRRRDGRGAARDRERQRLVAAAARAAEPVATGGLASYVERPASGSQPRRREW
jgi:hypothetical protein